MMRNTNLTSKWFAAIILGASLLSVSCDKDKSEAPVIIDPTYETTFHLGYGVGYSGSASAYVAPLTNLKSGSFTFEGDGKIGKAFETARTHRLYASIDGKFLYDLEYGNGKIVKYSVSGNNNLYNVEKQLDVKNIMGTTHPRWKVIDDTKAFLFEVTPKHSVNKTTGAVTSKDASSFRILEVNLTNFTLGEPVDIKLPSGVESAELPDPFVWRVDNAIMHKGKVYIGTAVQGFDSATQKIVQTRVYGTGVSLVSHPATTLVLDYNNGKFGEAKLEKSNVAIGENYGYRAPSFAIDGNDLYNITMEDSKILKINTSTGKYDDSYEIKLGEKLALTKIGGTGFFYASNGIVYAPFYDAEKGSKPNEAAWGVARINLRTKDVIKMNLPEKLWLQYYQSAKVDNKDGKLHMAICPTTGSGNIYIFDPSKADANGFEKGATLQVSGEGFYMGIY